MAVDLPGWARETSAVEWALIAGLSEDERRASLAVARRHRFSHRDLAELRLQEPDIETITLTRKDLAQLAGTTRPTANKVFRATEAFCAIKLGRDRSAILDRANLARPDR